MRAASKTRFRRFSPTRWLRIQQPPARQEQFGQRGGYLQPVQVLRQASVAHLLEAEDPLDHPKHVLNLGADAGLATVGGLDRLIDAFAPSKTLIGEVLRSSRSVSRDTPEARAISRSPDPPSPVISDKHKHA